MSKVKNEATIKKSDRQGRARAVGASGFMAVSTLRRGGQARPFRGRISATAAVKRCGLYQGAGLVKKGGTQSLKGLRKTLFTKPAQWMFEMDVKECTDDLLAIDFSLLPAGEGLAEAGLLR